MTDGFDIIQEVIDWNQKRDLLRKYDPVLGPSFIFEELCEILGYHKKFSSKEEFREYCMKVVALQASEEVTMEEQIDGYGDIIVYAIGELAKLTIPNGIDPRQVLINICFANREKGLKKDKDGKIIKDPNFIEPTINNTQESE